ncbi:MAG TPA: SGNH/GDSL hydrolase family protein [Gemmatimonadaceae bacterium]|nr:SGNH/GDSL hydrolase family protein [Gemmatimonadaceae bacterium]
MTQTTLDLTDTQRARLASRKIFFAHQSVGGNVLQGVADLLQENPGLSLRIVRSADPAAVSGPAIVETPIGENGDPSSKAAAFAASLANGLGVDRGIALYKYCYLDFGPTSDAARIFEEYQATVQRVRAANPTLTIVHVTVPLTVAESPVRHAMKRLLGRPAVRDVNAKRNEFNRLMRAAYGGKEPLFDLAAIESTRPDGSRSFEPRGRDTVFTLAPDYTDDGGHLNARGRRLAATQLLQLLASLN